MNQPADPTIVLPMKKNRPIKLWASLVAILVAVASSSYLLVNYVQNRPTVTDPASVTATQATTPAATTAPSSNPAASKQVPASFPKDLSLYPDATVAEVAEADNTIQLQLQTSGTITEVTDFYRTELAKNGWDASQIDSQGQATLITTSKGNYLAIITLGLGDNSAKPTVISISVTIK